MGETFEAQESPCPYCGEPVISHWTPRGCLPNPDYVLIADWLFHTPCWEKQVEENPP